MQSFIVSMTKATLVFIVNLAFIEIILQGNWSTRLNFALLMFGKLSRNTVYHVADFDTCGQRHKQGIGFKTMSLSIYFFDVCIPSVCL